MPVVGNVIGVADLGIKGAKAWRKVHKVVDRVEKRLAWINEFKTRMSKVTDYFQGKLTDAAVWAMDKFERGKVFEYIASKSHYLEGKGWKWFGDATADHYSHTFPTVDFVNDIERKVVSFKSLGAKDVVSSSLKKNIKDLKTKTMNFDFISNIDGTNFQNYSPILHIVVPKGYLQANIDKIKDYVTQVNGSNTINSIQVIFESK